MANGKTNGTTPTRIMVNLNAKQRSFVIGSQKMAALDLQEVVGLKRKQIATTYMLP